MTRRGYDGAWRTMAEEVARAALPGLRVCCPTCKREGTLLPKWKPGLAAKPLFVVHANGCRDALEMCSLSEDQASLIRSEVRLTARDVRKTLRMGRPFVLFSGGQDSLCVLEYMRNLCEKAGVTVTALHADTTAGFPEVERYVKRVCRKLGVPLVTVSPPENFFDLAKKWGIPGVRARWCCKTLKVAPMRRFLRGLDEPVVIYDGIRAAESSARAKYTPLWFHPSFRCVSVSPIFTWSDSQVERYVARHDLPRSPAHKLGCSAECWCGAYKARGDFERLLDIHPEIFNELVAVEEAQGGRFTFMYENGHKVALESLRKGKQQGHLVQGVRAGNGEPRYEP